MLIEVRVVKISMGENLGLLKKQIWKLKNVWMCTEKKELA